MFQTSASIALCFPCDAGPSSGSQTIVTLGLLCVRVQYDSHDWLFNVESVGK